MNDVQLAIKNAQEITCEWLVNSAEYTSWSTHSRDIKPEDASF